MTTFGVTGHQRASAEVWGRLRQDLNVLFAGASPLVGVSSLAAGADQEFAVAVERAGGALHAVLPCRAYCSSFESGSDLARFNRLLSEASDVETLDFAKPSEDAYMAAGRRVVDLCDVLVAVWDGFPARGKGGTADVVRYARSIGTPVKVIWPSGLKR